MSTPRSRRRSRLSNASNPSQVAISSRADPIPDLSQDNTVTESPGKNAEHNEDTEEAVQYTQGSRSRRRSRLRRATTHSPAQNDSDLQTEIKTQETQEIHKENTTTVDTGVTDTVNTFLKDENSRQINGDLNLPSLLENKVADDTEMDCYSKQDDSSLRLTETITEKDELPLKDNEYKSESSQNCEIKSEEVSTATDIEEFEKFEGKNEAKFDAVLNVTALSCDNKKGEASTATDFEAFDRFSLLNELRTVREGLSNANKTFVQYFDTIQRKEKENDVLNQHLVEEKNRRFFDKCMHQLVESRGERIVEFSAVKTRLEDEISRKEEDIKRITNLLLKEKQQRLLAKCHVELSDRRRRVEVRKLSEIVAQEAFKRKELEVKLKSLLPEIKNLKSLVDLNEGTTEVTRTVEMNPPKMSHQDLPGQLDRTAQLLVHTKAHLFDVVNVYQQTNEKVNDLEAAIFKARKIARDLFDSGIKILEKKTPAIDDTTANSGSENFPLPASVLLKFTQNATWLAGLLATELPSTPWQGPSRRQGLDNSKNKQTLYDPLGLYTPNKGFAPRKDSGRLERSSKNHKGVPVSARLSGSELKRQKPVVFRDDTVFL